MDLKEIAWEDSDGIHLVQNRDQWWVLVNLVINLLIP
jgi:hypothetical protein